MDLYPWTDVAWGIALDSNDLDEEMMALMTLKEVQAKLLPTLSARLFEAMASGEILAFDSQGGPLQTNELELEPLRKYYVYPDGVNKWLKQEGYPYIWKPGIANNPKNGSRQTRQEWMILRAISNLGHNPRSLPPQKGFKRRVRDYLEKEDNQFVYGTVFNKAWQRLRNKGEIQ